MKKISYLIPAFMLIMGMWSCKSFEGATITAKPDPIEVHADSIKYEVKVTILPKANLKKGGVYLGEGLIGKYSQRKVTVSADKYPDLKKTGMDTTLKIGRPYMDDMDGNPLMVRQSYERRGKTFELPDIENLAQCCITTSRLVWEDPKTIPSEHEYQKEVPINLEAKFNFPKNIFEIQEDQYDNSDIIAIGEFISKKYPATSITIEGFASPEGPYDRNVMLSVNRSKEVQTWLTEKLKEAGYENYLDTNFFSISVTHEDWVGFKASVNSLPYDADVKSQILEIISAGLDEDKKESQIMALVGGKQKVENILAPLRRATIKVKGFEPRRTDEEIDQIAQDFIAGKFEGDLSKTYEKEEWLYAISRVEEMADKKPLLEAFREAHPSDPRAFNDLGIIRLSEGDAKGAKDILEKAANLKSNDAAINNNLGAAYVATGDLDEGMSSLQSSLAAKSTPEASFNLGVILEKQAKYTDAVDKFTNAGDLQGAFYNRGLSKLLNNDLGGAKADLTTSVKANPETALVYYLLSVTGARAGDASLMSMNLKKACELDARFKDKARKDLEFRKFWNSAEFQAATR